MANPIRKMQFFADAAWRLGPRAGTLGLWGKGPGAWLANRRLGAKPMDFFAGRDIRPLWEAQRWADLPADPQGFCAAWMAANPPFQGPHWRCGQEAAIRTLHLALALPSPLPAWARPVLTAHARRIAANPAYAMAQDNNHPLSEAAGLLACGLLLGQPGLTRLGAARLERHARRLITPDGAFAQPSPAYHRLMLEVLVAAETLRCRWSGPAASPDLLARARAATLWLSRMTCPLTGALPRIGHQDGSAFFATAEDARPGLAMAKSLFGTPTAGPTWRSEGFRGWFMAGARAVLRTGPLRFRPAHADLLHFDLWDGPLNLLRDGGTGAYNPAPENAWWLEHFWSVRAHNTVQFDADEPMPRLSRFLHAQWPATGEDAGGDWVRDANGRRHSRAVRSAGREWRVHDALEGRYATATLRWRLAPMPWRLLPDGAQGDAARITITADGPLAVTLEEGWESLAYGEVSPCPVLVARGAVGRFETLIRLRS